MVITPKKRLSYDPQELSARSKPVGQGGIAICTKYEIGGQTWVEKELLPARMGEEYHADWFKQEARILANLRGTEEVVRLYGCYRPKHSWNRHLLTLMMEYIEDGASLDMYNGVKDIVISAAVDISTALKVMREKGIVHRALLKS